MSIPSLADHLAGVTVAVAPGERQRGRVHTVDDRRPTKASGQAHGKAAAPIVPPVRVHRIAQPEEDHELPPQIFKPVTPDVPPIVEPNSPPEGGPMPRGQYPRKPKVDANLAEEAKAQKPRKKRNGAKHRALPTKVGDASFVIDDRGRMRIKDGQQEISLERADVQRLTVFLDRTKTIRA